MASQQNRTTSSTTYRTSGNLALAPSYAPSLTVIEGGAGQQQAASRRDRREAREARVKRQKAEHLMRVRALVACAFVTLAIVFAAFAADGIRQARHADAFANVPTTSVTVGVGGSLWSLAEEHPVKGQDTSAVIAWIKEANGLENATLVTGQTLLVPAA